MDTTFEPTVYGSGWGADANASASDAPKRSFNMFEKIPMPIPLDAAINLRTDDDKYHLGTYGFSTVYTCGKIANIITEPGTDTRNFELCDPEAADEMEAPKLTVCLFENKKYLDICENDVIFAFGKLRLFDNALTLTAFAITKISDKKQIECFKLEAELAKVYFENNYPEKVASGPISELESTAFNNLPNVRANTNQPNQSFASHNAQQTFAPESQSNTRGLSGAREKIFVAVRDFGSVSETGIHVDEIRKRVGNLPSLDADLQYLSNEEWRDLICTTNNGKGPDKLSDEPADCKIALREYERDTQRRIADEQTAGCFDEIVNGTTRTYCDLLCPGADTVYLIKRDPQVHRSCFVFYTHRLERRGDDWFLWRDKKCRNSQITITARCEFLFPRSQFPADSTVFEKLRKRN